MYITVGLYVHYSRPICTLQSCAHLILEQSVAFCQRINEYYNNKVKVHYLEFVCVCVCVCVFVCVCVCVCEFVYVDMCECLHACAHAGVHACVCACMRARVRWCVCACVCDEQSGWGTVTTVYTIAMALPILSDPTILYLKSMMFPVGNYCHMDI